MPFRIEYDDDWCKVDAKMFLEFYQWPEDIQMQFRDDEIGTERIEESTRGWKNLKDKVEPEICTPRTAKLCPQPNQKLQIV